jgi:hypothetical protein
MADKTWTMAVKGIVSRMNERARRVPVPAGQYTVRELGAGDYEISGNGQPHFRLTAKELEGYIRAGEIDLVSGGRFP